MLEALIKADIDLFLFLNGFHNLFWDKAMLIITHKYTSVPLYLATVIFLFYRYKLKSAILLFVGFITLVTLADQSSVQLFKNVFMRLRPCFNPDIAEQVHVPDMPGGKFGFVSSHATNVFAYAVFSLLIFKNRAYTVFILLWATIVSYSRIYLGVHFPGDIIGGALLGALIGYLLTFVFRIRFFEPNVRSSFVANKN